MKPPPVIDLGDARYNLYGGLYKTPRFRLGQVVVDEVRGEVTIVGITDGKIPWPIGKTKRAKALVIFRGLAKAIRKESVTAIAYWWGVSTQTVTVWRKGLKIQGPTIGEQKLASAYGNHPKFAELVLAKAHETLQDPARTAKISAALRGKPKSAKATTKTRAAKIGAVPDRRSLALLVPRLQRENSGTMAGTATSLA